MLIIGLKMIDIHLFEMMSFLNQITKILYLEKHPFSSKSHFRL